MKTVSEALARVSAREERHARTASRNMEIINHLRRGMTVEWVMARYCLGRASVEQLKGKVG